MRMDMIVCMKGENQIDDWIELFEFRWARIGYYNMVEDICVALTISIVAFTSTSIEYYVRRTSI